MSKVDRRSFVGALALSGLVAEAGAETQTQADAPGFKSDPQVAKDVTPRLARYIVSAQAADVPAAVPRKRCALC